jgi:phosphonate transport system substrate-binding protein
MRLSELKGKRVAFAAVKSTSGNLLPRYLLAEAGIHLKDLGGYKNFDYHDSVVKRVLRGEYDAGAVRDSVANRYKPLGIRIIARSAPIPTGPVVVGPKTSYITGEIIKSALLNINKTERGRKVLRKLDPEFWGGFIEARDSDYQAIRDLINNVPETCGMGCHPKIRL